MTALKKKSRERIKTIKTPPIALLLSTKTKGKAIKALKAAAVQAASPMMSDATAVGTRFGNAVQKRFHEKTAKPKKGTTSVGKDQKA